MRKLIAAINMTLDGFCDHTAVNADDEVHFHYANLLKQADTILYGRITFDLMKYWQTIAQHPTGEKAMDEFAVIMDQVPKIVFSRTLKDTGWESATLANRTLEDEVLALTKESGRAIFIGSRSLMLQLMKLNLIDEYQICVHPVVAGGGLPLFENIKESKTLQLTATKTLSGGAVILYYTR
jgi:dihydrofolate reductase